MSIDDFMLDRNDALLLIIDIQERLAAVMSVKDQVLRNVNHLVELCKMADIPVVVTEQYPKGLGRTVPEIRASLPVYQPVEKKTFNCCSEPLFMSEIKRHNRRKIIISGMETHICVLQTCIGLIKEGLAPHIVSDAVCSRTKQNWRRGLELMRDAGGVITCTETALFQLLGVAGTEEFKAVSKMIK